jgi:predicted acylesterase/phospholipase RssA
MPPFNKQELKRNYRALALIVALVAYFVAISIYQRSWAGALLIAGATVLFLCLALLHTSYVFFFRNSQRLTAGVLIVVTALWLYVSDSYRYGLSALWDVLGILLGGMLMHIALRLWRGNTGLLQSRSAQVATAFTIAVGAWIGVTIAVVARTTALPIDPKRFASIDIQHSIAPPDLRHQADLHFGVALSGGGFRAALFHAGTLHALETLGIKPTVMSTVSGGSIIGAYYANGGDPVVFKDAVASGRFNLIRQLLLAHNALRLMAPMKLPGVDFALIPFYRYTRLDAQREMLQTLLFGGRTQWKAPEFEQPELMMATTDLTYGLAIGFLRDGILVRSLGGADAHVYRGSAYVPKQAMELPRGVATSGAFPIAFPSQEFNVQVIPYGSSGTLVRKLRLADGGIADNLGIALLRDARLHACVQPGCTEPLDPRYWTGSRWNVDVMVISDASAIFGVQADLSGVDALSRTFDVVSAKISQGPPEPWDTPELEFSPEKSYLQGDHQFLLPNNSADSEALQHPWRVGFDPSHGYSDDMLAAIIALLSADRRQIASKAHAEYVTKTRSSLKLGTAARSKWDERLYQFDNGGECERFFRSKSAAEIQEELKSLPGICEAVAMRTMVREEQIELFEIFKAMPTLEDWPEKTQADAVYRLGQLLVYTNPNWRHLKWSLAPELKRKRNAALGK